MNKLNLICALLLLTNIVFGQINESRLDGLEAEIEWWINEYQAVGLSVAIVEDSQVLYAKGIWV